MMNKYKNKRYTNQNFEEFVEDWDGWITSIVRKFNLHTPMEDVKQDIYLALLDKKYLDKFDPSRGTAYTTYLYVFIQNVLKKEFVRNRKDIIHNSLRMHETLTEEEFGMNKLSLEKLDLDKLTEKIDKQCIDKVVIEQILEILDDDKYDAKSAASNGTNRDLSTLIRMLAIDLTIDEISKLMEVSKQYLYQKRASLKTIPAIQEIMREY